MSTARNSLGLAALEGKVDEDMGRLFAVGGSSGIYGITALKSAEAFTPTAAYSCYSTEGIPRHGICVLDPLGNQTAVDCNAACKPVMYSCNTITGKCAADATGTQTQAACSSACKATPKPTPAPAPPSYKCIAGQCVITATGTSVVDCEALCFPIVPTPTAGGLGAGADAGIVAGVLAAAGICFLFGRHSKRKETKTKEGALLGNEYYAMSDTVGGDRA
jgi:hypothetical protein